MSAVYLDSSAFVKVVVRERGSAALRAFLAGSDARRVSSALLRTEAMRAVRDLGPDALAAVREGIRRVDLIGIDDRILDVAGSLPPGVLRTLDAIHLATALLYRERSREEVILATHDAALGRAARACGVPVLGAD